MPCNGQSYPEAAWSPPKALTLDAASVIASFLRQQAGLPQPLPTSLVPLGGRK